MNFNSRLVWLVCGMICTYSTLAQGDWKQLPLTDITDFKPQAGNWQIVSKVVMDPSQQAYKKEGKPPKKKKKGAEAPEPIQFTSGVGVLVNRQTEAQKDHLITNFSHGDLLLELEVMLPKGSNSGIYLQGRYEIQLLDSWGLKNPAFSDIGGVYRNWESDPEKSYMGKAPLVNAAKAPGLWQKIRISFRAPRFNDQGVKVQSAKILYAELNGVRIHENVEIPTPTGGSLENNEVPKGPIMIQGDHGEVAFRNIRYKLMKDSEVFTKDVRYELHLGEFRSTSQVLESAKEASGTLEQLTYQVTTDLDNNFGVVFQGTLVIPESDQYTFKVFAGGQAKLTIDGKVVSDGDYASEGEIQLDKGDHPFELVYFKNQEWVSPRLGMSVSTRSTNSKNLHNVASAPPRGSTFSLIYLEPTKSTRLLRAFLDFQGDKKQRLTHTIGVGDPNGIHYVYDLQTGNLVCSWKGPFIEATSMWSGRGDGSFRPLGMTQYLFTGPSISVLSDMDQPFSSRSEMIRSKGYQVDPVTNRPAFQYLWGPSNVTDVITPDVESTYFKRTITVENPSSEMYLKLAEGSEIELISNGWYLVEGQFYIAPGGGSSPIIREIEGKKELIIPVTESPINYSLIW